MWQRIRSVLEGCIFTNVWSECLTFLFLKGHFYLFVMLLMVHFIPSWCLHMILDHHIYFSVKCDIPHHPGGKGLRGLLLLWILLLLVLFSNDFRCKIVQHICCSITLHKSTRSCEKYEKFRNNAKFYKYLRMPAQTSEKNRTYPAKVGRVMTCNVIY